MASRTAASLRDSGRSTAATALTGLRQPQIAGTDGSHCGAARPGGPGPGRTIGPGPPASEGKWAGMSIGRRIATLFRVKADKALDRACPLGAGPGSGEARSM
jgi:hypothetical protein